MRAVVIGEAWFEFVIVGRKKEMTVRFKYGTEIQA